MAEKSVKSVLIVDDETKWHGLLQRLFAAYSKREGSLYEFHLDTATSAAEGIEKMKRTLPDVPPDVVVLDIRMESLEAGITPTFGLSLLASARTLLPVVIVFTGHPTYSTCVKAMRNGVWDYIVKEDVGGKSVAQIVVDSAVARLRQLDLRAELEDCVDPWLLVNETDLWKQYPGQIVALWHLPAVTVVASGADPFELQRNLETWREQHQPYEEPYLMRLPAREEAGSET